MAVGNFMRHHLIGAFIHVVQNPARAWNKPLLMYLKVKQTVSNYK